MRAEEEFVVPLVSSTRSAARARIARRSGLVALAAMAAMAVLAASAAAARPSFDVNSDGAMTPKFRFDRHDYAVRCSADANRLLIDGAPGWQARVGTGKFRGGDRTIRLRIRSASQLRIAFRNRKRGSRQAFHVRCLPRAFPDYSFHRNAPGGPKLFSMQLFSRWAVIFDRNGAPVWWYRASGEADNFQILADGTIAFDPVDQASLQTGDYEIRTLRGRLLRVVRGAGGATADIHEIQLLPNGNYLIGAQVEYQDDVTAYGGSPSSTVIGIEIQEITPDGDLVSSWDSRDHIGLEESGRWWDQSILDNEPYDVVHWNSAELIGKNRLLLSFRHLDAVYLVNRRSGKVIWKLGGTETPESLDVLNDPHGDYPLGGQHDARLLPDGSISIHDNRTGLGDPPRAVRYRVNTDAGTARLVQSIEDPEVPTSFCCGSARRLDSGDWLIGWGGDSMVGGYDSEGNRLFDLELATGFSYRTIPVPDGAVTLRQLRRAMDAMG
jgi:arylsulfotransferase ASST